MENVRKHREIKLVTTNKRGSYLVSEPNYHTTKYFSKNLLATEMRKLEVKVNKPVYLDLSILENGKTLMYGYWYDYTKPKYPWNFIQWNLIQIMESKDHYQYAETKKVIGLMKDELGVEGMTEFVGLKPKYVLT